MALTTSGRSWIARRRQNTLQWRCEGTFSNAFWLYRFGRMKKDEIRGREKVYVSLSQRYHCKKAYLRRSERSPARRLPPAKARSSSYLPSSEITRGEQNQKWTNVRPGLSSDGRPGRVETQGRAQRARIGGRLGRKKRECHSPVTPSGMANCGPGKEPK